MNSQAGSWHQFSTQLIYRSGNKTNLKPNPDPSHHLNTNFAFYAHYKSCDFVLFVAPAGTLMETIN